MSSLPTLLEAQAFLIFGSLALTFVMHPSLKNIIMKISSEFFAYDFVI